jgi:hypothetical protein
LNFYAYADGNPVSLIDPFGLGAIGEGAGPTWLGMGTYAAGQFPGIPGPYSYSYGNNAVSSLGAGVLNIGSLAFNGAYQVGNGIDRVYAGALGFAGWVTEQLGGSSGDVELVQRALLAATVLIGPEGAAAKTGSEGFTTLYRSVSHAEYADITASGLLRPGPNSYATGKFFAETGEHAARWGRALEGAGNFRVIEAQFPTSTANQFMRWQNLDNIGPARFGTLEQLGQPTIRPWPGSP